MIWWDAAGGCGERFFAAGEVAKKSNHLLFVSSADQDGDVDRIPFRPATDAREIFWDSHLEIGMSLRSSIRR